MKPVVMAESIRMPWPGNRNTIFLEGCDGKEAEGEVPALVLHWPKLTVPDHRDALMCLPRFPRRRLLLPIRRKSSLLDRDCCRLCSKGWRIAPDLEPHFVNDDITKDQQFRISPSWSISKCVVLQLETSKELDRRRIIPKAILRSSSPYPHANGDFGVPLNVDKILNAGSGCSLPWPSNRAQT
jgi:hypothetical protein